jgi:beta-lactamase superfamily II metal-dependent hydrolase
MRVYKVGQANTIIIKEASEALVVDMGVTGTRYTAIQEDIENFLRPVINCTIILTHTHKDHTAGVKDFLQMLGNINRSSRNSLFPFPLEKKVLKNDYITFELPRLNARNLQTLYGLQGWVSQTQTDLILQPFKDANKHLQITALTRTPKLPATEGENHNSLIMSITAHLQQILLTGDATGKLFEHHSTNNTQKLTDMLQNTTLAVLPHHGSESEGSGIWFDEINAYRGPNVIYIISSDPRGRHRIPTPATQAYLIGLAPGRVYMTSKAIGLHIRVVMDGQGTRIYDGLSLTPPTPL